MDAAEASVSRLRRLLPVGIGGGPGTHGKGPFEVEGQTNLLSAF